MFFSPRQEDWKPRYGCFGAPGWTAVAHRPDSHGRLTSPRAGRTAFTLVELLVSITVLLLLMLMMVAISNQVTTIFRTATSRSETFRAARDGFETMTRRLSQATLNTYYDYYDAGTPPRLRCDPYYLDPSTGLPVRPFVASQYLRTSELRIISGLASALIPQTNNDTDGIQTTPPVRCTHAIFFQAPLGYTETSPTTTTNFVGLNAMLNTVGYYTEYTSDKNLRPSFIASPVRNRFRLMEMTEPSESLSVYNYTSFNSATGAIATLKSTDSKGKNWFQVPLASFAPTRNHVLAENIVALILQPQLSRQDINARVTRGNNNLLSPNYSYDSTLTSNYTSNTLPPDENSKPDAGVNPRGQLPPVVQVTMVAIDEASAIRIEAVKGSKTTAAILDLDPAGSASYFAHSTDMASNYQNDLTGLLNNLTTQNITYRVFTSQVPIRAARWSTSESH